MRWSRKSRRLAKWAALATATPIVGLTSAFTLGAYLPRLPRLGVAGSLVWPTFVGPGLLVSVAGIVPSLAAAKLGAKRYGGGLALFAAASGIGSAIILADQVREARRVGAPIDLSTFSLRRSPKVVPDATVNYLEGNDGQMDVYLPPDVEREAPLMVYVHGGGWIQGARDEAAADLRWFADQGYVVLAPEYSLAIPKRPTWDTAINQIGSVLAWAVEHAADWGADPHRLVVWGGSAGANLALVASYAAATGFRLPDGRVVPPVAAVAGEVPAVDPLSFYDNPDGQWGSATRAMVETYIGGSAADYPERIESIRVNNYVSPKAPPTLLTACIPDHLVPVAGIRNFVTQARAAGVDIRVRYRRWGDHLIAARYYGLPNQTMLRGYLQHFRAQGA